MHNRTGWLLLPLMLWAAPASADEVLLVDPLSGTVQRAPSPGRDPALQSRTGTDRARSYRDQAPQGSGSLIILEPVEQPGQRPARTGDAGQDSRRSAEDATDRARAYGDEAGGVETGGVKLDAGSVLVIEDGEIKMLPDGTHLDNPTRMQVDLNKARAYQQGQKPCGSVLVGGIGEGGAASGSTSTRDVYTLNSNCR